MIENKNCMLQSCLNRLQQSKQKNDNELKLNEMKLYSFGGYYKMCKNICEYLNEWQWNVLGEDYEKYETCLNQLWKLSKLMKRLVSRIKLNKTKQYKKWQIIIGLKNQDTSGIFSYWMSKLGNLTLKTAYNKVKKTTIDQKIKDLMKNLLDNRLIN